MILGTIGIIVKLTKRGNKMIIRAMGMLLWLLIVPFSLGLFVKRIWRREQDGVIFCIVTGYMIMFALFECLAEPLILGRRPFHILVWLAGVLFLGLTVFSLIFHHREVGQAFAITGKKIPWKSWTFYAALILIGIQVWFYVKYMVTNIDDAYYVATAAVALETDTMYQYSAYTGRYNELLNLRYVLSPYPIFQAFLAKVSWINDAAVIAHTAFPPFLVSLAYSVYALFGELLFEEPENPESGDSKSKQIFLFLCLLSVVHITSYYCMRNQGSVLLVRVWQGKATLASSLIPALFYQCYRMSRYPKEKGNLVILLFMTTACCMVSSMGVALSAVLLGVMAFLFGMLKKNWRYFMNMVLGVIPPFLVGVCYLILKGLR